MKILIIEDEYHTAKDLAKTINVVCPDAEIIGIIDSVEDAIDFLKEEHKLDLIFSDIQLGDGLSFEIFQKTKNAIPVIFCTAYNEYALEAFKNLGIDYILKPFTKNSVLKSLEKFENLRSRLSSNTSPENNYDAIIEALTKTSGIQKAKSIVVQMGDKITPIDASLIAFFFTENAITYAYTFEQKKIPVNQNLETLENSFKPAFFRANRQFLVNKKAVKDATHSFNRKIFINLNVSFHEQISVGKLKITAFMDWLSQA